MVAQLSRCLPPAALYGTLAHMAKMVRIKLKDGAVGRDGIVLSQEALRQIAVSKGGDLDLTDAAGKVIGRLQGLRMNGRREVHADFDMGDLTPVQVRAIMGAATPTISSEISPRRRRLSPPPDPAPWRPKLSGPYRNDGTEPLQD